MKKNNFRIGTSGWSYADWRGRFYPQEIKSNEFLQYYSRRFNTVEINNSFYRLPTAKNIKHWHELTPDDFIFSCKASRYITHMKRLHETEQAVDNLLAIFSSFQKKLGPILFQFPPSWRLNSPLLKKFAASLSKDFDYVLEFRNTSWFCPEIYDLLNSHQIALCFYDYKGYQSPEIITAPFVYLRLHGPKKSAYEGSYSTPKLAEYAQKIASWKNQGKRIYCYFDNDKKSCAPINADCLISLNSKIAKPG